MRIPKRIISCRVNKKGELSANASRPTNGRVNFRNFVTNFVSLKQFEKHFKIFLMCSKVLVANGLLVRIMRIMRILTM